MTVHWNRTKKMIRTIIIALAGIILFVNAQAAIMPGNPEYTALVALHDATGGDTWTDNSNWKDGQDACNWSHITCDMGRTHVIQISLNENHLNGTLPEALNGLTQLQVLNVSNGDTPTMNWNALPGPIPAALSSFSELIEFDANHTQLTGAIPALSGFSHLVTFRVKGNQLTGNFPDLTGLSNLVTLDVSENQIGGVFAPTANSPLTGLSSLQNFTINDNQIGGYIPSNWGQISTLISFDFSSNQLVGSLPSLAGLSNVTGFNVSNNRLTGLLPTPPSPSVIGQFGVTLCPNPLTIDLNDPNAAYWNAHNSSGLSFWWSPPGGGCDLVFQSNFEN